MRAFLAVYHSAQRRAFSLVEVALAVAVLAVALVGVFALMPSGMASFRTAMDISITAQIAQRVLQDAQQAEFDQLIDRKNLPEDPQNRGYCPERFSFRAPAVGAPAWRYFDEQGTELLLKGKVLTEAERRMVVYQVNTRIRPRAEMPTLRETVGQVAQVTVQVIRNPNLIELAIEERKNLPEQNLVKPSSGVAIFTYSALIGKNQGQ
jgi:prepilin-type N-terminal cleavage/methylation domain-containing protein